MASLSVQSQSRDRTYDLFPHGKLYSTQSYNKYFSLIFLQHGNAVRQKWLDLFDLIAEGKTKQRPPNFEVPDRELPCRLNVQPGTWFARDNVFNFILFCRKLGNFLYYTLCTYVLMF